MTSDPSETRKILNSVAEALKRGDRVAAQRLARRAVALAPETEEPWLILAALSSPARSLTYVKKALEINPESKTAQKALEWALSRSGAQPAEAEAASQSEQVHPVEAGQLAESVYPAEAEQLSEEIHAPSSRDSLAEKSTAPLTQRIKSWLIPTSTFRFYLLGLLVIVLIAELVFLQLMLSSFLADPSPQIVCNPNLVIGKLYIQVETLKPGPDGSLHYPSTYLYRAYWVEGTAADPVFLVSPAPDNQSLVTSFGAGKTATVTWVNCSTASYRLSAPQPGSLDSATLLDQSAPAGRITIFFPTRLESSGYVIQGELPGKY